MANVIFKFGPQAKYDALAEHDSNTLYWLTDSKRLYKGDVLFGTGATATAAAAGLLSPEDKAKLDAIIESGGTATVVDLVPVDASVIIADTGNGGKSIGVCLSKVEGNALEIRDDGLFVAVPAIPIGGDGITIEDGVASIKLDDTEANGLFIGGTGLALALATSEKAGAMSAEDKATLDAAAETYATKDALAEAIATFEASYTWGEM